MLHMRVLETQTQHSCLSPDEISVEFAKLSNTYKRLKETESYENQILVTQTYYEQIIDLLYNMTLQ